MIFKIGDKFEEEFVLTKETYQGFIEIFKDKNPLYINSEFAFGKGFKEVVMHGNILNGYRFYL